MSRTIHLAILDADIPARELYQARGLYSSQIEKILQKGVAQLNQAEQHNANNSFRLRCTAYDLLGGVYPAFELLRRDHDREHGTSATSFETSNQPIDAIWITGAAAGIHETEKYPWILKLESYIKHVYVNFPQVRILGTCFGHQLIAHALLAEQGAVVERSPWGRRAGLYSIKLDPTFMDYFPVLSATLHGGLLRMQMLHADWVTFKPSPAEANANKDAATAAAASLPHPWVNLGCTKQCPIQGLYSPGRVLTIQGHFEMDACAMYTTCRDLGIVIKQIAYMPEYGDDAVMMAQVVGNFLAGIEATGNRMDS